MRIFFYIANNGDLLKTLDGGLNWKIISLGTENEVWCIHFFNSLVGIAGGMRQSSMGAVKKIWKTYNGGLNWVLKYSGSDLHTGFFDLAFFNSLTGFAVGDGIAKTYDNGETWGQVNFNYSASLTSICMPRLEKAFTCGRWGLYGTSNGGSDWLSISIPYEQYSEIYFSDSLTGYIVGDAGRIFKTTNGGEPIGIKILTSDIPVNFSLHQNYPNPFNPTTKIRFDITPSPRGEGGRSTTLTSRRLVEGVRLIVFDLLGREVVTLVNEQLKPGTYEVEFPAPSGDGSSYATGVYIYKIISGNFVETKKMILIR